MIDEKMQALIDAPLANALRLNIPPGKRPSLRSTPLQYSDEIGGKVPSAEVAKLKAKAANEKLSKLFDYYATTDLTAAKVAEHMGLYRQEQTGTDEETGKPVFARVLDTKRAEDQLAWRRKA